MHAQLLHSLYCKVYLDNSAVLLYKKIKIKNPMKFPEGNKESVTHKQVEEKEENPQPCSLSQNENLFLMPAARVWRAMLRTR